VELRQNFGEKRRYHVTSAGRMLMQGGEKASFNAGNLEFNIEKRTARKLLQNLVERGQRKLMGWCAIDLLPLNLAAANRGIVANHGNAIGGKANVELESVAAVPEAELE